MAQWIIRHLPAHEVYVEPYCGAASILMQKARSRTEVINDIDSEVVNVFRVLRNRASARELERLLRLTPFARDEFNASYEPCEDPIERARRTVVRSFMGHGAGSVSKHYRHRTGFRSGSQRANTAAEMDWTRWPDAVAAMTARLAGVLIENRPAVRVIRRYDSASTLFYVDPPYVHATRSRCDQYKHEMSDDEHRELAAELHEVEGMVVLSGYQCDLYEELYGTWRRREVDALADGAAPRVECLWLNPATSRFGAQIELFGDTEACTS